MGECPALDPTGRDIHGQAAHLRAMGPAVKVELPGGVHVWSVNNHAVIKPASQFAFGAGVALLYGLFMVAHVAYGPVLRHRDRVPDPRNVPVEPALRQQGAHPVRGRAGCEGRVGRRTSRRQRRADGSPSSGMSGQRKVPGSTSANALHAERSEAGVTA